MRIPVVDSRGIPLMPCPPAKARLLLKAGKAKPKRNKLGLFYVQLTYEQEPDNQPLVAGIDPGSQFEGYSVVGTCDTVMNLMAEAPTHVKEAIETRRTMRRARRSRKWRRPARFANRLKGKQRIPPSTRSRWEAKARIMAQLLKVLPLTDVVVEDVCAVTRPGKHRKWNQSFSPVQTGKEHLYHLLQEMGLMLHTQQGWQTKELREKSGLKKTRTKSKQSFDSHCVDSWVLAASISGALSPTCQRLWYVVPVRFHRRQLHRLQASKGGERKPYGGRVASCSSAARSSGIPSMASVQWAVLTASDKPSACMPIVAMRGSPNQQRSQIVRYKHLLLSAPGLFGKRSNRARKEKGQFLPPPRTGRVPLPDFYGTF